MFIYILFFFAVLLTLLAAAVTAVCMFAGTYLLAALSFLHLCAGCLMVSTMYTAITWRTQQ